MRKERKAKPTSIAREIEFTAISIFVPLLLAIVTLLFSMLFTTREYRDITASVTYASNYQEEFKERMDYSMYLAVIGNKSMSELGDETITVNGVHTVNPYEYIDELQRACNTMEELATVESNSNQVKRIRNSLSTLSVCVQELDEGIQGAKTYDENMLYLDENIYVLTSLIEGGIQDYVHYETVHFEEIQDEVEIRNMRNLIICVFFTIAAIGSSFLLSIHSTNRIVEPIQGLCKMTTEIGEGNFDITPPKHNIEEIQVLTNSFQTMTWEIEKLLEDVKQQQKNLHLVETKLLQAQINPHFLYNTLDAIIWLAEDGQTDQVVEMVSALSQFFRTTLSKGRDVITVKEEENHIDSYLQIQQFRYQDILEYKIEIQEELYDYVMPKLTLQPIVENALYHGIKNKRGKGMIRVSGSLEESGEAMVFVVEDNGKGMTEEELQRLQEALNLQIKSQDQQGALPREGFGIGNVMQRIQQYYGEGYGITYESFEEKGTKVTIRIAAKKTTPLS